MNYPMNTHDKHYWLWGIVMTLLGIMVAILVSTWVTHKPGVNNDDPGPKDYDRWNQRAATLFVEQRQVGITGVTWEHLAEYDELLRRIGKYRVDHPGEQGQ